MFHAASPPVEVIALYAQDLSYALILGVALNCIEPRQVSLVNRYTKHVRAMDANDLAYGLKSNNESGIFKVVWHDSG